MPDLISLPRTPIREHPVEIIVDSGPEQKSGTGWSLSASFCGGFIPHLIRGSKFYQPVFLAGLPAPGWGTLTYIIAGVIIKLKFDIIFFMSYVDPAEKMIRVYYY